MTLHELKLYKIFLIFFLLLVNTGISNDCLPGRIIAKFNQTYRDQIKIEKINNIAVTNIDAVDSINYLLQVYKIEKIICDPNPTSLAIELGMDLIYLIFFPENYSVQEAFYYYEQLEIFEYVEPDLIYPTSLNPNDPRFNEQWHLIKIQCPLAWDIIQGNNAVKIMIIDQGIDYTHNELENMSAINAPEDVNNNGRFDPYPTSQGGDIDNVDQDNNNYIDDVIGYDFFSGDPDPKPETDDNHGTCCAGIAVAQTNNNLGIAGISWGCRYINARCGSGGGIYLSPAIAALYYAVQLNVWVVSMSFGGRAQSSSFNDAIQYAWQGGCVLIASAGNTYSSGNLVYPACYPNVIAVAASDQNDLRSVWSGGNQSNYGTWIDVTAPGTSILTTKNNNEYYDSFCGTSAASPCVAGQVALIKSLDRNITNDRCTLRIFRSCDPMPNEPQYIAGNLGHGRINIAKAVLYHFCQPDNQMKNYWWPPENYVGNDIYSTGVEQSVDQCTDPNNSAIYHIKIENDATYSNILDKIKVVATITYTPGDWTIRYFNALTGGDEITNQITSTGWFIDELAVGQYKEIRVEVTPGNNTQINWPKGIKLLSQSYYNPDKTDVVWVNTHRLIIQPDLQIKNSNEISYLGNNVYNTNGIGQHQFR